MGKTMSSTQVLQALLELLHFHGFFVKKESDYHVIKRYDKQKDGDHKVSFDASDLTAFNSISQIPSLKEGYDFFVYKVQYHSGMELEQSLKKIAVDMRNQSNAPLKLVNAIQSLQSTLKLFFF
jgi:hypothetical protein